MSSELPVVSTMMELGWISQDFLVKKQTLSKASLLAYLKAHTLEARCKSYLRNILESMPRGLQSASVTTSGIVNFLLSVTDITFHGPGNAISDVLENDGSRSSGEEQSDNEAGTV